MSRPNHTTISATNALPKVVRGKGSYLWDATGKQYIDGSGGPAVYCLGHAHPEVNRAICDQLEALAHGYRYNFTTDALEDLTEILRADGHNIRRLDLGGGLGIPYTRSNEAPPLPLDYGALIKRTVGDLGCEIEIEPGRLISGNAGLLVSSVIYVKNGEGRDFLIVDAAMNDLVRPSMYGAHHDIVPVIEPSPATEAHAYDVVGPVCETGDTLAKARPLAPLAEGDLIAFRSAGAYGAVMASEYNTRPLIPEVLVQGDQFAVIRARPTYDEILNRDSIPAWL